MKNLFLIPKKKEQEILNIELNQIKRSFNVNKDINFDYWINIYEKLKFINYGIDISLISVLISSIKFSIDRKNTELALALSVCSVVILGLGIYIGNKINQNLSFEKHCKEGIKISNLYLNNMDILENEIEIIDSKNELIVTKITPNNLDEFSSKNLQEAIDKEKSKKKIK